MRVASLALTTVLNAFLRRRLPPEIYERLAGRQVRLDFTAPAFSVAFHVRGRHFVPERPGDQPWLRFRASARDFAAVAAREEDADTLFFQRRLLVEGDTETGLLVKNALEALEAPRTRKILRRALRVIARPR